MKTHVPPDSPLCALVTGSSRGIGRVIAGRLADRGVRVIIHYARNQGHAEAAVASLAGSGHGIIASDLAAPDSAHDLWTRAETHFGPIDLLINNAGIYELHDPVTVSFAEWKEAWERTINTNLIAPAHLSFLAGQAMATRQRGRIVAISSRGAFRGEPSAPAYGASKAGLNSLSQSLAKALAPQQVGVFVVAPGWVSTEMAEEHLNGPRRESILKDQPLGRVTEPGEVARIVEFCALDAPLAMTGSIIDANGASYLRT